MDKKLEYIAGLVMNVTNSQVTDVKLDSYNCVRLSIGKDRFKINPDTLTVEQVFPGVLSVTHKAELLEYQMSAKKEEFNLKYNCENTLAHSIEMVRSEFMAAFVAFAQVIGVERFCNWLSKKIK